MRRLLPCALAALTLTSCGIVSAQAATPVETVAVVKITDGDTFHVRNHAGRDITVRLLGVDASEVSSHDCWSAEATQFATDRLLNQVARLVVDPTQAAKDRYRRTLAYLALPDGSDFSTEAARAGAVRSYVYGKKPVQRHAQIVAAELEAKQARRGMWGACG